MPTLNSIPIITGLHYGNEGKGATTAAYVNKFGLSSIVRFNGGPQRASTVRSGDMVHSFRSYGSTLDKGVTTVMGPDVLVNPLSIIKEGRELDDLNLDPKLAISEECLIITPYDVALNRVMESLRATKQHHYGSAGLGIGTARNRELSTRPILQMRDLMDMEPHEIQWTLKLMFSDTIKAIEAIDPSRRMLESSEVCEFLWDYTNFVDLAETYVQFASEVDVMDEARLMQYLSQDDIICEGAQGILLDEHYGTFPHNTWTDTTPRHAANLLREAGQNFHTVGVTRTFFTRHGAGPFVSETGTYEFDTENNPESEYKGCLRTGHFDMVMFKYALEVCEKVGAPINAFAITHMDKYERGDDWRVISQYKGYPNLHEQMAEIGPDMVERRKMTSMLRRFQHEADDIWVSRKFLKPTLELSKRYHRPIAVASTGPDIADRIFDAELYE